MCTACVCEETWREDERVGSGVCRQKGKLFFNEEEERHKRLETQRGAEW